MPLPPVPKVDAATGAVDWTQVDQWVKTTMASWPFAQGAIQEFLALKGGSLTGDEVAAITKDLATLQAIYTAAQAGNMTDEQRGKFLVDTIFMTADAIKDILSKVAPDLVQYIPLFLLGTGV